MPKPTNVEYRDSLWKFAEDLGDIATQAFRQWGDNYDGNRLIRELNSRIYASKERDVILILVKAEQNAPSDKKSKEFLDYYLTVIGIMRDVILHRKTSIQLDNMNTQLILDESRPDGQVIVDKYILDDDNELIYLIKRFEDTHSYKPLRFSPQSFRIFRAFLLADKHILTKTEINVAASPNNTSSSNQFKNRLKRLRDDLESNGLSRQTITDFFSSGETKYILIIK